jgi:hypothetical protein
MWIKKKKFQILCMSLISILLILQNTAITISEASNNTLETQTIDNVTVDTTTYRALLIAIDTYQYSPLFYSVNQLEKFKNTLLNGKNWKESDILTLKDTHATKEALQHNLHSISQIADDNDVTIIYFIGHGGRNLTNEFISLYDSPVYDVELAMYLNNISGNIVIVIDSCYSGGFIEELQRSERVIITACAKEEITYQIEELESGFFGYFFDLSISWLKGNVEISFLLTKFLIRYYGRKVGTELNIDISIHPQIYDGIRGPTYIIKGPSIIDRMNILLTPLILPTGKIGIWTMNN